MTCMAHAVGSLGTSLASGHRALCLLQMHGNCQCQMDSKACCAGGSRRGQRQATCSGHAHPEWPRLVTDSVAQVQVV